jgi:hypothetical protein
VLCRLCRCFIQKKKGEKDVIFLLKGPLKIEEFLRDLFNLGDYLIFSLTDGVHGTQN